MKLLFSICGLLVASLLQAQVMIVPKPAECRSTDGGVFDFGASTALRVECAELSRGAAIFAGQVGAILGFEPAVKIGKAARKSVNIALDPSLKPEEYIMDVTGRSIDIVGGSAKGTFHALQSLRQMLIPFKGMKRAAAQSVHVKDAPFFAYRGMMLDVCRHFRTVDEVKEFIDLLSLHKLNVFHWHLTDDQGWRMPVDRYPLLTQVGSQRAETVVGHARDSKTYDGKPYGKGFYYTKDQIREVIAYAAARNIEVIPEVEMPGHAMAALAAYPWLGCRGEGYRTATTWGIFDDVFCAGKESTFELLENVLAEVIELFPAKYVHIGGDECPKARWKECPLCQKRIKDNNLADEHQLQSYFIRRIEKFVNSRGKSIIGWEEILEGGVSGTATVMAWKRPQAGIEAAKLGNSVIMAPSKFCYFDYYQSENQAAEPFAIGGFVPVSKVYQVDPYAELNSEERKTIIGLQANLWMEYIPTMDKVEYMVLPRMAALAESGWSYDRRDYSDFLTRMQNLRKLYDACGYNYAKHIFQE
ncbi:hypothetical protein FACS1894159_03710 [Bacteroidia bacterium]|nr:hypothetical protein FACS1894159_03710 [Bacteroidia bacterium]